MADDDEVVLQSCEGQEFRVIVGHMKANVSIVTNEGIKQSRMNGTIANLIEDAGTKHAIPIPNVSGPILEKVIIFSKYHAENPDMSPFDPVTTPLSDWDKAFLDGFNNLDMAVAILCAANYLENRKLVALVAKHCIAEKMKRMTTDEMCETFGITERLTPEEEARIRRENSWIEEK